LKHAGTDALDQLEALLAKIREFAGVRERKRGAFYRGTSAFLHFHEDPAGLFADLKIGCEFVRFPVNNQHQVEALLSRAANELIQSAKTESVEQANAATRNRLRNDGR
jgi:hypothetical protein